jgi:hypothetical protein
MLISSLQVNDELGRMTHRLDRLRLVHASALSTTTFRAAISAAHAPSPLSAGARRAPLWTPGVRHDEIKLSHTSISSVQVAALVMLLTREEFASYSMEVRRFWGCWVSRQGCLAWIFVDLPVGPTAFADQLGTSRAGGGPVTGG